MTANDQRRRLVREYVESACLVFLGLMVVFTSVQSNHRANQQQDELRAQKEAFQVCITRQVTGITDALQARSRLTEPGTDSVRDLIVAVSKAESQADFDAALNRYLTTQQELADARKKNPYPSFPDGKCAS